MLEIWFYDLDLPLHYDVKDRRIGKCAGRVKRCKRGVHMLLDVSNRKSLLSSAVARLLGIRR